MAQVLICLPLLELRSTGKVYDMVYVPAETPLLVAAKARGLACANGLGMLAAQGAAAFSLWTGREAPCAVMRRKLHDVLESLTKDNKILTLGRFQNTIPLVVVTNRLGY